MKKETVTYKRLQLFGMRNGDYKTNMFVILIDNDFNCILLIQWADLGKFQVQVHSKEIKSKPVHAP